VDGYPFECPIQVRWRDLDAFGHVNNAAVVTYLEVARTALWRQRFGGKTPDDIPFFVSRVEIDYRRPLGLYDEIRVGVGVSELRGARFTFRYRVEALTETAAMAHTVLAYIRPDNGRVGRIPPELRAKLETFLIDPDQA
jgi:acyl-CoA thioester hydrolase